MTAKDNIMGVHGTVRNHEHWPRLAELVHQLSLIHI